MEKKVRLTWKEIQETYPDQWVGLAEIEWLNDSNIKSAVVLYNDKSKKELALMQAESDGNIVGVYTTPQQKLFIDSVRLSL